MKQQKIDLTKASLVETLETLNKSLDQITENEDGGKITIPLPGGKKMVFTMPPKGERIKK